MPGVGQKTAARLLLELQARFDYLTVDGMIGGRLAAGQPARPRRHQRLARRLAQLGYAPDEARARYARRCPRKAQSRSCCVWHCGTWRREDDEPMSPRREILADADAADRRAGGCRAEAGRSRRSFDGDAALEVGIRPKRLADFVGQHLLREKLEIVLEAARRRGQPVDHVLFAGPPGLGKTTLAGIMACEMGAGFRVTSGPALVRSGDVAAILTDLQPGDVLFIDEIHRMGRAVEELLYPAMEDFQLDIVLGRGPTARSIRLDLPKFTLVGATTRTGLVTGPLRDRFGIVARLELYSDGRARSHRAPHERRCSASS